MKTCSRCHKDKPESDFWRKRRNSPDLSPRCKDCDKSAKRESRQRHLIERRRHERESYRQRRRSGWSPLLSPAQKEQNTQRLAAYYENHLDRLLAKIAVREAVIRGELIIQDATEISHIRKRFLLKCPFCPLCGRQTPRPHMHGHHYEGYTPEKRLMVLFICRDCHAAVTAMERSAILEGLPPIAGLAMFIKEKRDQLATKMITVCHRSPVAGYNGISGYSALEVSNVG